MSEVTADVFPMDETICKSCAHRMSRIVVPLDYEMYGIDPNEFDLDDEEDLLVEQHICLVLQQDLDGLVRECNRFADLNESTFFIGNPYTNK